MINPVYVEIKIDPQTTFVSYFDTEKQRSFKHPYPDWEKTGVLRYVIVPNFGNQASVLDELSHICFSPMDGAIDPGDELVYKLFLKMMPDFIAGTTPAALLEKHGENYLYIKDYLVVQPEQEYVLFRYKEAGMDIHITITVRPTTKADSMKAPEHDREYTNVWIKQ